VNKYGGLEVQIQTYVELNGHFYALDASPPNLKYKKINK
jgi:hypothetical protein